jgi:hypothetical protein
MNPDDDLERLGKQLLARIAEYGFTYTGVFDHAGVESPFLYTIGLPAHIGRPELVMCGLRSYETMIGIIASVVDLLRASPELEGRVVGALQRDVPVWVTAVPSPAVEEHLCWAQWWREEHHDGEPATAKQIIIPGPRGLFPWEPGCEPGYGRAQARMLPEILVREPALASARGGHGERD